MTLKDLERRGNRRMNGEKSTRRNEPKTCPQCSGPLKEAGVYGRQKIRGRQYKCTDGSCNFMMRRVPYDMLEGELQ